MSTVQLLLTPCKGVTTDLSVSRSADGLTLFVYAGASLLETIANDPGSPAYRMLLARLVNARFSVTLVARTFGHDTRTLRSWARAVRSGASDQIAAMLTGRRGAAKVTPEIRRFVVMQYRDLRHRERAYRRKIARQVQDVFCVSLSRETLRLLFREADRDSDSPGDRVPPSTVEPVAILPQPTAAESGSVTGCPLPTVGDLDDDKGSPFVPPAGQQGPSVQGIRGQADGGVPPARSQSVPWHGPAAPEGLTSVHHVGLILFSVWMDVFRYQRGDEAALQSQWLCQVLQGAVNVEQATRVNVADMGLFLPRVMPCVQSQRVHMLDQGTPDMVMDIYAANARLLPDGPGGGEVFFYDPHSKECTGAAKMLKSWCARTHGIAKVLHHDVIHTPTGFPCFIQHYDAYYDLRERIFMTLALFDKLFAPTQRSGRTFILDRGIFGHDAFEGFHQRRDYLVTWLKGYKRDRWQDDLPAVCFELCRSRNDQGDLLVYRFEMQSAEWDKDPRFRLIIVRATNPSGNTVEVAVLCSNPTMEDREAVTFIFSRWVQENGLKYLDEHAGLMQITSYRTEAYEQIADTLRDRDTLRPEYRDLKTAEKEEEAALGKLLVKEEDDRRLTEQLEDQRNAIARLTRELVTQIEDVLAQHARAETDSDPLAIESYDDLIHRAKTLKRERKRVEAKLGRIQQRSGRRQTEIGDSRERLNELREQLARTLRKTSRIQQLIDDHYVRPDVRSKALFDALKVTAMTMFRLLLGGFRPIYGNHRNDHALLRELTRADGFVLKVDGVLRVGLWLKGRYQPRQKRAFETFLGHMSRIINIQFSGRAIPVDIRIVDKADDLYD